MKALLIVLFVVAGCGGGGAGSSATAALAASAGSAATATAPTPSSPQPAASIDASMVLNFKAALDRLMPASRARVAVDVADWPAYQVALNNEAEALDAFAADLEAIGLPSEVGQLPALIYWSRQLAIVLRQTADGASWEAAKTDTVEWEGSSYDLESFIREGTGEWAAALSLTATDLGVALT